MARQVTEPLASLVKQVDDEIARNGKLKAFVVLMADDPAEAAKQLEKLAADKKLKNVPLTVFTGSGGPPDYQVNRKAAVTVMMWNQGKVEVNHAFAEGELTDTAVPRVVADIPKILKE